jgi:hypothetical protein
MINMIIIIIAITIIIKIMTAPDRATYRECREQGTFSLGPLGGVRHAVREMTAQMRGYVPT